MRIRPAVLIAILVLGPGTAGSALAGSSGLVVDSRFFPLPGAQACLVQEEETGPCSITDGGGEFTLPDSEMTAVRITLAGFLPARVKAVDHVNPIMLERAASIKVLFRDSLTGELLADGEFYLDSAEGARIGPFPVSAAGTRVKSLRPGTVAVRGQVAGYTQDKPFLTELYSGNETVIEVRLSVSSPAR